MLFDIYADSQEDIEAIRKAAVAQLKNGGLVLSEWTTESTTVQKVFGIPLKELLTETLFYLKMKDPLTYGRLVTRTRPNFNNWF